MFSSLSNNNLKISDSFQIYTPTKFSHPSHPAQVVEAVSLSYAKVPEFSCKLKLLSSEFYEKDSLSCVQLEAIALATQKHSEFTPEGFRYGFFLGDSAGIGKGRTIAGMFLENYLSSNKKGLWLTVSTDLFIDCSRDTTSVSNCLKTIEINSTSDLAGVDSEGVLLMTYHGLSSKKRDKNLKNRLDYIIEWLGNEAEAGALVVFDESHRSKGDSTGIGKVVKFLQNKFKKLRVIYSTATAAANAYDFTYMSRLGLFPIIEEGHPGFVFSSSELFAQIMEKRGISAMESLAIELKEKGLLISRQLSFNNVETIMIKVESNVQFEELYEECCLFWTDMYEYLMAIVPPGPRGKTHFSVFWMNCLNFFQTLVTSSKIQKAVEFGMMRAEVYNNSIVYGLQKTGDSQFLYLNRMGVKTMNKSFSHAASILAYVLNKLFQIDVLSVFKASDEDNSAKNESQYEMLSDEDEMDPSNFVCVTYDEDKSSELKDRFSNLYQKLPKNPLDDLVFQLGGPKRVAEMTGRKFRSIYTEQKQVEFNFIQRKMHTTDRTTNVTEKKNFQNGSKIFAVISDAASTGTSLHSDHSCENQNQRVHITLECAYSAEKYIQQLGRTHRSNQIVEPIYVFFVSPVPAEDRFIFGIADKLTKLGAMTKGDRNTTQTFYETDKCLNTFYGDIALSKFINNINSDSVEFDLEVSLDDIKEWLLKVGLSVEGGKKSKPSITRFLNRILCCPLLLQKDILAYYYHLLDVEIELALLNKTYNAGVLEYKIPERAVVFLLNQNDYYYNENKITYSSIQIDYGVSWDELPTFSSEFNNLRFLFYKKEEEQILLAFEKDDGIVYVIQPNDCRMLPLKSFLDLPHLNRKNQSCLFLKKVNQQINWPDRARNVWTKQYLQMQSGECIHQYMEKYCKDKMCSSGSRINYQGVVSGSLNSIWNLIETVVGNVSFPLVKITCENDQEKLIGVLLENDKGDELCSLLEEDQ